MIKQYPARNFLESLKHKMFIEMPYKIIMYWSYFPCDIKKNTPSESDSEEVKNNTV